MSEVPAPALRRPVATGCALLVASVVLAVALIGGCITFLESGSDTGRVTLQLAAAYGEGTVTRVADRGLYVVRLRGPQFVVLDDLDAANRAAAGRRCRVAPVSSTDPALPGLLDQYRRAFSPEAAGSSLIFREDCNGALYDATGLRLDGPGPNLDRYSYRVDEAGFLTVETAHRTCTTRDGPALFAEAVCG